jgi:hypothetical protein
MSINFSIKLRFGVDDIICPYDVDGHPDRTKLLIFFSECSNSETFDAPAALPATDVTAPGQADLVVECDKIREFAVVVE